MILNFVPPSPPNITLIMAISSSTLFVSWVPSSNDGGSPVTFYVIEYRPTGDFEQFESTIVSNASLTTEIQDLLPYTHYDVRLRAINIAGIGEASDVYIPVVRTHPGSPSSPEDLTFTILTPSTLSFSWNEPSALNGELGIYQLVVTSWVDPPNQIDTILFVDQYTVNGMYMYINQ